MMDYRVYFRDGNQRLFVAKNMYDLICWLWKYEGYSGDDIWKIEEV